MTLELPGGGGYGPPWERDPARVVADVRAGYVSVAQARDAYGVALNPATLAVQEAETARLRAALAAAAEAER